VSTLRREGASSMSRLLFIDAHEDGRRNVIRHSVDAASTAFGAARGSCSTTMTGKRRRRSLCLAPFAPLRLSPEPAHRGTHGQVLEVREGRGKMKAGEKHRPVREIRSLSPSRSFAAKHDDHSRTWSCGRRERVCQAQRARRKGGKGDALRFSSSTYSPLLALRQRRREDMVDVAVVTGVRTEKKVFVRKKGNGEARPTKGDKSTTSGYARVGWGPRVVVCVSVQNERQCTTRDGERTASGRARR
jgi:hypothetical protein